MEAKTQNATSNQTASGWDSAVTLDAARRLLGNESHRKQEPRTPASNQTAWGWDSAASQKAEHGHPTSSPFRGRTEE